MCAVGHGSRASGSLFLFQEQEVQELAETFKQEQGVTELENNIQVEEIEDLKKQLKESADYCKKFEKESKQDC